MLKLVGEIKGNYIREYPNSSGSDRGVFSGVAETVLLPVPLDSHQ